MKESIKYFFKLVWDACTSRAMGLQWRDGNQDWRYIPVEVREWQDENGEWCAAQQYLDFPDQPYYVCVAWSNGHHTPLPIALMDGQGPQSTLARFFNRFPRIFQRWHAALIDCAYYEHQFEAQDGHGFCVVIKDEPESGPPMGFSNAETAGEVARALNSVSQWRDIEEAWVVREY